MLRTEANARGHQAACPTADGVIASRPARVPTCQTAARRSINQHGRNRGRDHHPPVHVRQWLFCCLNVPLSLASLVNSSKIKERTQGRAEIGHLAYRPGSDAQAHQPA
jgi:hypothetical protein